MVYLSGIDPAGDSGASWLWGESDFTILHPRTYKEYYWEHFGKADDNSYALTISDRIRKYCSIQIVPSLDLIMTFETKERPLDPNLVEETIQYYFGM